MEPPNISIFHSPVPKGYHTTPIQRVNRNSPTVNARNLYLRNAAEIDLSLNLSAKTSAKIRIYET